MVLIKKNKVEGLKFLDCMNYHKAIVIKTVWNGYKNRHID